MSKNAIPDRWINYTKIGKKVENTRFINFKVPLNKNINNRIEAEDDRFTLDNLIEGVVSTGQRIGLIIDLTNTTRYYNSLNLKDMNVEYAKILTEGHIVPSKAVRRKFFQCVESFLAKNKTDLIGIHCTHGVNRSGYLVCKYMITHLNIDPKKAISDFNAARGHNLERSNYIADLWNTKPSTNGLSELRSTEERVYWKERSRNHHEPRSKQNKMRPDSYRDQQRSGPTASSNNRFQPYSRPSQHRRNAPTPASYDSAPNDHHSHHHHDHHPHYNYDDRDYHRYHNEPMGYREGGGAYNGGGGEASGYPYCDSSSSYPDNDYRYNDQNNFLSYEAGPSSNNNNNNDYYNDNRQYYNMDTQQNNPFPSKYNKLIGNQPDTNKVTHRY